MRDTSKLTDAQREYVVERLAAFESPIAIARSLQEEFGIRISHQAIVRYDPTRSAKCPERFRLQFFATRRALIEGKAARGAANAILRTRRRERLMLRAVEAIADRIIKSTSEYEGDAFAEQKPLTDGERSREICALIGKVKRGRESMPGLPGVSIPPPTTESIRAGRCVKPHAGMSDLERLRGIAAIFKEQIAAEIAMGNEGAKEEWKQEWLHW
jgi:hypothetical protein